LSEANQSILAAMEGHDSLPAAQRIQLTDPQTAGGMLVFLPTNQVEKCIKALREGGYPTAAVIGTAMHRDDTLGTAGVSLLR